MFTPSEKYDYLIVGAGLYGATFARLATDRGLRCLVIDKRHHAGGNIYCEEIEGINVHRYGAHIFHTSDRRVWDFVNRFVEFNRFTNSPVAIAPNGRLYNLPFNLNTFAQMWGIHTPAEAAAILSAQRTAPDSQPHDLRTPADSRVHDLLNSPDSRVRDLRNPALATTVLGGSAVEPRNLEEQAISLVGRDIYEQLIQGYTEKQWGRPCSELPAFIIKRLPLRMTFDNNYFDDLYQGIPIGGYNRLTAGLLAGIEVRLSTDFFADRAHWESIADTIVYTGPIDQYFDYCYGHLEYRTLRFETEVLDTPNYQGNAVVNYTSAAVPYTRIIEHKHFEAFGQAVYDNPRTVITREYPAEWTPGSPRSHGNTAPDSQPRDLRNPASAATVLSGSSSEPSTRMAATVLSGSSSEPSTRMAATVLSGSSSEPSTRMAATVLSGSAAEVSCSSAEPYYPINDPRNQALYARYRALIPDSQPHDLRPLSPRIIFGGRLAEYRYYDMAPTIAAALSHFPE